MIQEHVENSNPFILTSMDGRAVFMNKNNPLYQKIAKANDRIVSVDCVLANEDRLIEVTAELGLSPLHGVFELQE